MVWAMGKRGDGEKGKRNPVIVALTPDEDRIVNAIKDEFGTSKQEIVRRVFSWFAAQDDLLKRIVLGTEPKGAKMQARMAEALREMADEIEVRGVMILRKDAARKQSVHDQESE
jgi:hypothetical protein